jgi:hypothetical protein
MHHPSQQTKHDAGDTGAEDLSAALRKNLTLTKLVLQGIDMTDVGAEALAAALEADNKTLTSLVLPTVSKRGFQALVAALETNRTLQDIDVRFDDDENDRLRLNNLVLKVDGWVDRVLERSVALLSNVWLPTIVAYTATFAFGDELLDLALDGKFLNGWLDDQETASPDGQPRSRDGAACQAERVSFGTFYPPLYC